MRLKPHATREKRVEKVVKHFFDHREHWWDVSSLGFLDWQNMWTKVRATNALALEGGWRLIEAGTTADDVITTAHGHWLAAAEQACDDAMAGQAVFVSQDRHRYVAKNGITVIVAKADWLVTAWRTAPRWMRPSADALPEAPSRTRVRARAAIRRAHRHASLVEKERFGAREGW